MTREKVRRSLSADMCLLIVGTPDANLAWLNKGYPNAAAKRSIRDALRKAEFKFGKLASRETNPLELELV